MVAGIYKVTEKLLPQARAVRHIIAYISRMRRWSHLFFAHFIGVCSAVGLDIRMTKSDRNETCEDNGTGDLG
jgi:hypothetical protein